MNSLLITFSINDEKLVEEFYRYCLILASAKNMASLPSEYVERAKQAQILFDSSRLGPICFEDFPLPLMDIFFLHMILLNCGKYAQMLFL